MELVPDNLELTNEDRASFARYGLDAYQENKEGPELDEITETLVEDFLADLMHLCDEEKIDAHRALSVAQTHYLTERSPGKPS